MNAVKVEDKTQKTGRKALSELEKARRNWVRAHKNLVESEEKIQALTGIPENQMHLKFNKDVIEVRDERIEINEVLNDVSSSLYRLQYKKDLTSSEEAMKLRLGKERKDLYKKLREMPEIGMTWDEYYEEIEHNPSFAQEGNIGRPAVSAELVYVRSRKALLEAEKEVRHLEVQQGEKRSSLKKLIGEFDQKNKDYGRPEDHEIFKMDAEVRRLKTLRAAAESEIDGYVHEVDTGTRERIHPEIKVKELTKRIDKILAEISKEESKLSDRDYMIRVIKLNKRNLREMNKEIKVANSGRSEFLQDEIDSLKLDIANFDLFLKFADKVIDNKSVKAPYKLTNDDMRYCIETLTRGNLKTTIKKAIKGLYE